MNLSQLIKNPYTAVEVDGVTLRFKKPSWGELEAFQKKAAMLSPDEESDDSTPVKDFVSFLLENFIRDENGEVIESGNIDEVPASFCVALIHRFCEFASMSSDDSKKK